MIKAANAKEKAQKESQRDQVREAWKNDQISRDEAIRKFGEIG